MALTVLYVPYMCFIYASTVLYVALTVLYVPCSLDVMATLREVEAEEEMRRRSGEVPYSSSVLLSSLELSDTQSL